MFNPEIFIVFSWCLVITLFFFTWSGFDFRKVIICQSFNWCIVFCHNHFLATFFCSYTTILPQFDSIRVNKTWQKYTFIIVFFGKRCLKSKILYLSSFYDEFSVDIISVNESYWLFCKEYALPRNKVGLEAMAIHDTYFTNYITLIHKWGHVL